MYKPLFLVPLLALSVTSPSQAGLFKKSVKPEPAVHVPSLIEILKSSEDEKARAAAATELDEYDAKAFPEILPALMTALASDPSSSVRSRAAEAIGKVRPITATAGWALERAAGDDKSLRVQVSARAALLKYKVLGHFPGKIEGQSVEPPLAASTVVKDLAAGPILRPTPAPIPVDGGISPPALPAIPTPKPPPDSESLGKPVDPQTGEPPLADPGKPALTTAPKAPAPIIVIPSSTGKDVIMPVPTSPMPTTGGPTLPPKD